MALRFIKDVPVSQSFQALALESGSFLFDATGSFLTNPTFEYSVAARYVSSSILTITSSEARYSLVGRLASNLPSFAFRNDGSLRLASKIGEPLEEGLLSSDGEDVIISVDV